MSLEHPSPPYHPLGLKLPRCARLRVSVIKYLGQTALNQTYSCVSITPVPKEPCTHTARSSVLCPELYTNLCPLSLPSLPQPTEQRSPSRSWSEARCSGSSSLLTQAFSWLCVCKWRREMVIDYIRIKVRKSLDIFLGACQRKECLRFCHSFKAEWWSSKRVVERIVKLNLQNWAGCLGYNDNRHIQEVIGLHWAKSKHDFN